MKMMGIAGLALVLAAAPASAAITVQNFLTRADALKAQGPMALMAPDFPVLKGEAQAATAQLKAERDARKAAGKPPIACPPEGQSIGIMQMLDGLAALSPAEKRLPLKDGYAKVLAKTYPCH
ncbi:MULTISPECIES: hypothetical protein [unclassified Sphingomonas]|uniref:hypothetical protein n=1 Tax=unclassified Sphingomonas TaxID=196159 RepID=UPI001F591D0B|nr:MULTISPECIES: hypothetical protein [unclassified Sphingomonas]